jgi:hypothetical protein
MGKNDFTVEEFAMKRLILAALLVLSTLATLASCSHNPNADVTVTGQYDYNFGWQRGYQR